MNPIGWHRARALALVPLFGCSGVDLPERPYDVAIDCRPETAPVLSTVEEAIAMLDADGDGALTDTDLRPGETAVIVALTGTHTPTGEGSDPGFTIHTNWTSYLYAYPVEYEYWGIEVSCNCQPVLNVFVNFDDDTFPAGTPLTERDFEGRGIGLDVPVLENHGTASTMAATVRVTDASGDRASGYLIGSGSSALLGLIPEESLTGQRLSVEAFAFRDILNREAN